MIYQIVTEQKVSTIEQNVIEIEANSESEAISKVENGEGEIVDWYMDKNYDTEGKLKIINITTIEE